MTTRESEKRISTAFRRCCDWVCDAVLSVRAKTKNLLSDWRKIAAFVCVNGAMLGVLGLAQTEAKISYNIITIPLPGVKESPIQSPDKGGFASGINNTGLVVGSVYGTNDCYQECGYIYDINSNNYITFSADYVAQALKINDNGQVVGYADYYYESGYIYKNMTTTILPLHFGRQIGINNDGVVAGYHWNGTNYVGRIIQADGNYTELVCIDNTNTFLYDINDNNQIIGACYKNSSWGLDYYFIYDNGNWIHLDRRPISINSKGQVLIESATIYDIDTNTYVDLDITNFPGNFPGHFTGFNDSGQIVGTTEDGQSFFIATPSDPDPTPVTLDPKNNGAPPECPTPSAFQGNPINTATGNKFEAQTDYAGAGAASALVLERFYNSQDSSSTPFGSNWRSTWHRALTYTVGTGGAANTVKATREDGRVDTFTASGTGWTSDADVVIRLSGSAASGFTLTREDDSLEAYAPDGRLLSITTRAGQVTTLAYNTTNQLTTVTGPFGHKLTFAYDANGRISAVTTPDARVTRYAYDTAGNLASVTYPDNTVRQYVYENTRFPHALTGILDEDGVRFATFAYDTNGRATASQHAGGAQAITVAYNADGSATITDALGNTHSYIFTTQFGLVKPTAMDQKSCNCGSAAYTYDANGFLASRTDFNGNVTTYEHNDRGLETSRTEALGTSEQRRTDTTWHPTFRLPSSVTEAAGTSQERRIDFTYDTKGNLTQKTLTASSQSRTWKYKYNTPGQVISVNGPRTGVNDVTTYAYNTAGKLITITDGLKHITRITKYDPNGRPLSITDPNKLVTTLAYDARGRIASRAEGTETTQYAYDAAGNLIKITLPDGSSLTYGYDAAHRLISVMDALGNKIAYTLDDNGNRVQEDVTDPHGVLTQTRTHVYDALNRLAQDTGAQDQTTTFTYDANGNLTGVADPLGNASASVFDALNQLVQMTDPNGGVTHLARDVLGQITAVTDPRGLTTTYTVNGLGNVTGVSSPDSGATARTFDEAGNVVSTTDAKGQKTAIAYDALNRPFKQTFADGKKVTFAYDKGTGAIGRLSSVTDTTGSTAFTHDSHGRVTKKTQKVGKTSLILTYAYDAAGRLSSITFPSKAKATYTYNAQSGRLSAIAVNGQPLITNIAYSPFGAVTGWTALGQAITRTFDLDGRMTAQEHGADDLALTYDEADRITDIVKPGTAEAFAYDPASRLTDYAAGSTAKSYVLDANGNRTGMSVNGTPFTYGLDSGSNRLLSLATGGSSYAYVYDPTGNLTDASANHFDYGANGRLARVTQGANVTNYAVNGLGLRVGKTGASAPNGTAFYMYDEEANLIGEYTLVKNKLTPSQEILWLPASATGGLAIPVGVLKAGALYAITPGHLGEPRRITNAAGQLVWSWDHDPFGNKAPNENPSGLATFTFNLRFPGQYYDAETGLFYNVNRDYDPTTGRYVQVDPIGQAGDLKNGYAYVSGNPVPKTDSLGLFDDGGPRAPYLGHRDFAGGSRFDYTLEDTGNTGPLVDPERHFRDLPLSVADVMSAIATCDRNGFQRAMHRGQDFFSHYAKGYRWNRFATWKNLGFGHAEANIEMHIKTSMLADVIGNAAGYVGARLSLDDVNPDHDLGAWARANAWTRIWLAKWDQKCDCNR